jgi:hypothetical protein
MSVFEPSGQPMHLRHKVAICLAVFYRNVVYALELIHRSLIAQRHLKCKYLAKFSVFHKARLSTWRLLA